MRKLLNKPWVVALLAVAALLLVAQALFNQGKVRPRPDFAELTEIGGELGDEAASGVVDARTIGEALKALELPEIIANPFAPREARVTAVPVAIGEKLPDVAETLHLSAIWEQQGASFVLLNGRICVAGDVVGGITVVSIERDGVWLSHWRGRDFLPMGQDFTLTTPAAQAANLKTANHEG